MISIPKTSPELIIFKPNKIRMLLFSIGLWSFLFLLELLLYWAIYIERNVSSDGFLAFWGLLILMPVILFYNGIAFLPKEGWLTLDSDGFQLNSYLKSRRYQYKWGDVQEFFITHQVINTAKVERISFLANIAGISRQKHFPSYRYQTSTREIVQILNEWKCQFTQPTETDDRDQPRTTIQRTYEATSSQTVEYPPTDPKIEKITTCWGCGFGIVGLVLFIIFVVTIDATERTIFKFYNLQPNTNPSLTLIVKNEYAKGFSVYRLPPIPYKKKLELSIPTPERRAPIQIQYALEHEPQCRQLQKRYGIFGQMDAIWINASGKIDAYASDFCQKVGKYDCRFIPDQVDISECRVDDNILVNDETRKNAKNQIKPMSPSDFKRLKEKTGLTF